jgi:hypothetical protein
MQVLEDKEESTYRKKSNSESNSISQEFVSVILNNPEHFKKLQEQINTAFSESERKNDDLISKANERMMKQTIVSILNAEEQNDSVIKELMHSITNKSAKETVDQVHELEILKSYAAAGLS